MADIAYTITADGKQAEQAIRDVAQSMIAVENQMKAMREASKQANTEQQEMGRMAKRIMEDAKSPTDRYYESIKKVDQLFAEGKISVGAYEKETQRLRTALDGTGKNLDSVAKSGVEAFGSKAIGMVKDLAGAFGLGFGLAGMVQLARTEMEALNATKQRALQSTITVANAEIVALRNLGPKNEQERDAFLGSIKHISSKTGVAESDLFMRSADALSARGDLPVSEVMKAVESSAEIAPESVDEGKSIAGASLDIGKILKSTPKQAIGYMMVAGEQAHVTETGDIARNLTPAMKAGVATGASPQVAAAVWAALTQSAVDPEGRVSSNASINFATQLEKYLPAKGDDYTEQQLLKDKDIVGKERTATQEQLKHDAKNDPQYLQAIRDLEVSKAELQKKKLHRPEDVADRQMQLREIADKEREAVEDSLRRTSQSEKYRDKDTEFTLREKGFEKRREESKAVIASGFKSEEDRIEFLQKNPEARKEFIKRAGFEAKADIPIRELISGEGDTATAYEKFRKDYPKDMGEADARYDRDVKLIRGSNRQQTAQAARAIAAGKESIESSPEMQASAIGGILLSEFDHILQDLGESALGTQMKGWGRAVSPDKIKAAIEQLTRKQDDLRHPVSHIGGGFSTQSVPREPTARESALSDMAQPIIDALAKIEERVRENTENRNQKQSPALGAPKSDPGDRN